MASDGVQVKPDPPEVGASLRRRGGCGLGSVRGGLLTAALGQLAPFPANTGVTMGSGVAVAVLVGWLVVPAAVGAWRTQTRDA